MKIKINFQKIFLYAADLVSSILVSNSAYASPKPSRSMKNMGQASMAYTYTATAETSTSTMSHAQELQHKISDFNVALTRAFQSCSLFIQQLPK